MEQGAGGKDRRHHLQIRIFRHMNHPAGKFLDRLDPLLGIGVRWHLRGIGQAGSGKFKNQDSGR